MAMTAHRLRTDIALPCSGMGFVKDFKDLLITRIFLGITEAGL